MEILHREDTPVDVLCGHVGEQWAAIERPTDSGNVLLEIVKLSTLSSPAGYADLYDHINEVKADYDLNFEEHLPLSVDIPERFQSGSALQVTTCNGEILYEVKPEQEQYERFRNGTPGDDADYAEMASMYTLSALSELNTAYTAPHRFLFEHQDNLLSI